MELIEDTDETLGGTSPSGYVRGPFYTNRATVRQSQRLSGEERREKMRLREQFERMVQKKTRQARKAHYGH